MAFDVPIVFIVFKRPDTTKVVFERIAEIRPRRLLIVADGPRSNREGEPELCAEVRRIATAVDWDCEVSTNFSPENLGSRGRVISGLNWAFKLAEEAIILEDDILPDPSFFPFCQQMLERFRNDERVSMISGFNVAADELTAPSSYFFSQLCHTWGWATWRRAWALYDGSISTWPTVRDGEMLSGVFSQRSAVRYWTDIFEQDYAKRGDWDAWDYQWFYTSIVNHMLSVVPKVNLIHNIGFGASATHSMNESDAPKVSVRSLTEPLVHPSVVMPWKRLDILDQKLCHFHFHALPVRAFNKLKRLIRPQ